MPRFIVTIRKPNQPTTYYLSTSGFRCYSPEVVAVFASLQDARDERDRYALIMPEFELRVERLRANLSIAKALLSAVEI